VKLVVFSDLHLDAPFEWAPLAAKAPGEFGLQSAALLVGVASQDDAIDSVEIP